MEATEMSTDRWMDKEAVVHIHKGIWLSHRQQCIWVSANEVDEPGAYYIEWSKSGRAKQISSVQILKDDAVKVLHSICQQIEKPQQWPQDWKRSVFIPIPKKGNATERSNYRPIALISHASKVMLKILQDRLQQYMNHELPDVQAGFRKGRGTRD